MNVKIYYFAYKRGFLKSERREGGERATASELAPSDVTALN